ncbi:hypothetical protein ACFQ2B_03625 [Streptomyces stramineus]
MAGLYEELPEQWRVEHPGQEPGERTVTELRVGVLGDTGQLRELLDALTALACPDPVHPGPCPVPWSAGFSEPLDEESRARLESRYGHLRG